MTTILTAPARPAPARSAVRASRPSLPTLVGLELRKSLSTRSGRSLAAASVGAAPAAVTVGWLTGEPILSAAPPIAVMGMLTGFVLLSLGVLATAGEWSHRTVQTTFLLVPHRGRVLAAKAVAVAVLGAAFAALSAALSAGVLAATIGGDLSWDGTPRALVAVVAAGAAFAVTGAGVGAALGNTPAALTGLYLVVLGVMPVLQNVKPQIASKIDPATAVLNLAQNHAQTTAIAILVGWVLVASAAGWVLTHRRAVQ